MAHAIYRFVRDLRLNDHAGLSAAAAHGDVLPVLIVDRALHARLSASPRRAAAYCAAVTALDASLRDRGSRLIVRRGNAAPVLKQIARACGASAVVWSASFDRAGMQADQRLQSDLEEAGLRANAVADSPAIPPEETTAARPSAGDGYRSFVPYHDVWRRLEPASFEIPLLLALAQSDLQSERLPEPLEFGSSAEAAEIGETQSAAKLERFLSSAGLQYAFAVNVPADDRTSHLGADLTFGTIGARTVVRETRKRIDDPFLLAEERNSLRLFLRSMAMRDFFLQLSWYNPDTDRAPLQEKMRAFAFAKSHAALDAWRAGRTGYPLVDAGIRQLHATGWMHPRVRAIAASFLCFDLGVDWHAGLTEWDRYLTEDDAALAVGNWQWTAGVGADLAAYPRIYNPRKQARRFDPNAAYIKKWLPELRHLPAAAILSGAASDNVQIELPLFSAGAYPAPVVDHEVAARAFLTRYRRFVEEAEK
ncbi:MAG TPA: deoxyribodipyrimidine photo-lyase [Candidatus Baltobacteraceae bacterium]|nr:deoxyribodipyrimidine photo-lyase [Candidatus Baltobacteraceae bacterium]